MKKKYIFVLLIFCFLIILGIIYFNNYISNSDDIQSKREWSILQELEYKYRDNSLTQRCIIENIQEYYAVGTMSDDSKSRVWLLLNPKYKPYIKFLPKKKYRFFPTDIELILRMAPVDDKMYDYLISIVDSVDIDQDIK